MERRSEEQLIKMGTAIAEPKNIVSNSVLRIRIRDPGLGAFLTPGSGMGESHHPDPGSGMNNPDHIF